MIEVLSVENMRKSDADTIAKGTPGRELMLRAAKGVFEAVSWKGPVAVVCGKGNNAGDGYALATLLFKHGIRSSLFLLSDVFSEDGAYYYNQCIEQGIEILDFTKASAKQISFGGYSEIVDCIFGTGFRGTPEGLFREAIEKINESDARVISVDINSGLNGNSGMAVLCVKSDLTVSIGSYKFGHFLSMAKDVCHEVINVPIGIEPVEEPAHLWTKEDFRKIIQPRKQFSNKGTYGYTALIGGSLRYSGAIRLAAMAYYANAAMRSGAGVVKVAVPESLVKYLIPQVLESTLFPIRDEDGEIRFDKTNEADRRSIDELISNVKTIAFGMGIGVSDDTRNLLNYILENYKGTLIVDADGLTDFAELLGTRDEAVTCKIVLTPHIKEFSRLTGKTKDGINADPVGAAKEFATYLTKKLNSEVVVLLKGPTTILTDGNKVNLVNRGCAGMATAGSGDVLSGILSAVCGWEGDLLTAATLAAFINGAAGELAEKKTNAYSMTAGDTAGSIPTVISELLE